MMLYDIITNEKAVISQGNRAMLRAIFLRKI